MRKAGAVTKARTGLRTLGRYFHTVRYLKPIQVAGRVWFKLYRPHPDTRAAPARRPLTGHYTSPVSPPPTLVAPETFRLLNVEGRCSVPEDWRPARAPTLWVYNLHYFDDLNARDAAIRSPWHCKLLRRWVAENPPGQGAGWDPYPVSRRIVNWVKWAALGNELPEVCHRSLAVQARWLAGRLEYHLLGNHLFANAKALTHAGLYFSGPEADAWYSRGMRIIERELREQVLTDGGHFERSSMYHAAALEDLLDLVNAVRAYGRTPPPECHVVIARMRRWLNVMSHPDGEIAFFNDAAFAIAPTRAELAEYAGRLGLDPIQDTLEPLTVLQPSGYVRAIAGPAYLLCDCAAIGPDHLPAHAHADTLSFELSLSSRRIFVNSGTSQYGTDIERQRQRGTDAHNTVVVNGTDSSEVWAGFRVARRARARLIDAQLTHSGVSIEASHDGYRRTRHGNEHYRRWKLDDRSLTIEDRITGRFHGAEAFFHLHPDLRAEVHSHPKTGTPGKSEVILSGADGTRVRMVFEGAACVDVRPGTWHPQFGVAVANYCVSVRMQGATLKTLVCWSGSG